RLCYMSQHNPVNRTTAEYLENIKKQGHGSVLEHAVYVLLIEGISRSCSHELVRHRAGFGYSQISQRYVDESHAAFVMPPAVAGDTRLEEEWQQQVGEAQAAYVRAVEGLMQRYEWVTDKVHRRKMAREAARSVLPNATEVKIVVSGNARAWRTMLELRCGEGAELEIRRMAIGVLRLLQTEAGALFSDFEIYTADDKDEDARVVYHRRGRADSGSLWHRPSSRRRRILAAKTFARPSRHRLQYGRGIARAVSRVARPRAVRVPEHSVHRLRPAHTRADTAQRTDEGDPRVSRRADRAVSRHRARRVPGAYAAAISAVREAGRRGVW